jgi:hypothetical protein
MLPCATQDFRNAVAEFDYVFSRIPRNSVPVRTMGGPQGHLLSLIACELFEDGGWPPNPSCLNDGPGLVITHRAKARHAELYLAGMLQHALATPFIAPCLPSKNDKLPSVANGCKQA